MSVTAYTEALATELAQTTISEPAGAHSAPAETEVVAQPDAPKNVIASLTASTSIDVTEVPLDRSCPSTSPYDSASSEVELPVEDPGVHRPQTRSRTAKQAAKSADAVSTPSCVPEAAAGSTSARTVKPKQTSSKKRVKGRNAKGAIVMPKGRPAGE